MLNRNSVVDLIFLESPVFLSNVNGLWGAFQLTEKSVVQLCQM